MYAVGERSRNPLLGVAGLGGYLLSHEVGFRQAARLVKSGRTGRAVMLSALSFIGFVLIVALGWERFRWQGTLEEFESGTARGAIVAMDFMVPFMGAITLFFLGALLVVVLNLRDR